jgi:hypothetical protein
MKKSIKHLAGLALASSLCGLPIFAQKAPRFPDAPPPPGSISKVEVDTSDDENALALAHASAADAQRSITKILTGDSVDRPLIVASTPLDDKAMSNLNEDLNIMARILDKSVERGAQDEDRKAMGIRLWALGGGSRGPRNLYIDGYGAVFTVNVNMPLLAPLEKPEAEEKKESTSSSWDEARNELYGRDNRGHGDFKRPRSERKNIPPFDAERVEALKKDLAEALKNATHIRGLKENEYVTVVVQGPGNDSNAFRAVKVGPKGEFESDVFSYAFAGPGGGARSVMTLRARKSDIDAFAQGKTELDDFRKTVSVATYQTLGSSGSGKGVGF